METDRREVARGLRGRLDEIESAIFRRVRHLAEPAGEDDPAYQDGLKRAVTEAVSWCIEQIDPHDGWVPPIPAGVAEQARRAARDGVGLDTVLRRYAAGSQLLEEFIVAEAQQLSSALLCQILREQWTHVDRLMDAVAVEYRGELERTGRSTVEKFARQVLRLLSGDDLVGAVDLEYDFDRWHLGMILTGRRAATSAQLLAERLGCGSLHVARGAEVAWAWLGSKRRPAAAQIESSLVGATPTDVSLAVGEPRWGLNGWRLTHREAQMAYQVMLQRPRRLTRGREVLLLAGILSDDTLAQSLLETYLAPLERCGSSGPVLRRTLRAYFTAGGNAAAAAAGLGVTRHTVQRRLRTVEDVIGQRLDTCRAELEVALEIDELDR